MTRFPDTAADPEALLPKLGAVKIDGDDYG